MLRVLLADDRGWARSALRLALREIPDLEVVGEIREAATARRAVSATGAELLLVRDALCAGGMLEALRRQHPSLSLVVLCAGLEEARAVVARGADHAAHVLEPPERLLELLRRLARGGAVTRPVC